MTPFDAPQAELAWMFLQTLCNGADSDDSDDIAEGLALLSEMSALGRRPATRVAPVMFAIQVTVPVILAPLIFGESWSGTPGDGAGIVASVLLVLAGVIALAGSEAVGAVIDSAHADE